MRKIREKPRKHAEHLLLDAVDHLENPQEAEASVEDLMKEAKKHLSKTLGFFHGKSKNKEEKENLYLAIKICRVEIFLLETISTSVKTLAHDVKECSDDHIRAKVNSEIQRKVSPILKARSEEIQDVDTEKVEKGFANILFKTLISTINQQLEVHDR